MRKGSSGSIHDSAEKESRGVSLVGEEVKKGEVGLCLCGRMYEDKDDPVKLYEHVKESGQPNFKCCQIPIRAGKKLNIEVWRKKLEEYEDKIICEWLEFGFPMDRDDTYKLTYDVRRNHKGAREYPDFIQGYLQKECVAGRILGPFPKNPLSSPLVVSPLNSVPKSNEDERRVIVDLSWPHGAAVNEGISKEFYLGESVELHYTSVEQICGMVRRAGVGSVIYKRDLRHAYRQFGVDPLDYGLLGYFWDNEFFIDTVLAMGQRNAAMACSRITNAIMFLHRQDGHEGDSFLDDLIGVSIPCRGQQAYDELGTLLDELGVVENLGKACPPASVQLVLGVEIDTINGTLSVPEERMMEINELLRLWNRKRKTTKVELQSLIGKLQYVTKCVRQSRCFLNRALQMLRLFTNDQKSKLILDGLRKDVAWWQRFMPQFNGVSYIPPEIWSEPDVSFSTDSSLKGCGGICEYEYFHATYPNGLLSQNLPIHCLEMLAVLVAVRFWGIRYRGGKIQIFCDNEAVVKVINTNRTRDEFLATCLRNLWLEVSVYGFELRAIHLPGVENRVADWLSRWDVGQEYQNQFQNFISGETDLYTELRLDGNMFNLSNDI